MKAQLSEFRRAVADGPFSSWCRDHNRPISVDALAAYKGARLDDPDTGYGTWTDQGIRALVNSDPSIIWNPCRVATDSRDGRRYIIGGLTLTPLMHRTGRSATSIMRALGMKGVSE